tara:strand:+ start:80951 stop:81193 length:243 start_codon:yes stop_codon:yes gene_type:complete
MNNQKLEYQKFPRNRITEYWLVCYLPDDLKNYLITIGIHTTPYKYEPTKYMIHGIRPWQFEKYCTMFGYTTEDTTPPPYT